MYSTMFAAIMVLLTAHDALAHKIQLYPDPKIFLDKKAIANGAAVYSAVCSGDSSSRKIIQRLLGTMVVFEGDLDELI